MFMERWAEDATYFCWQHVPPKGLDVWQFWARMIEAGAAFKPGASSCGACNRICCVPFCSAVLLCRSSSHATTHMQQHLGTTADIARLRLCSVPNICADNCDGHFCPSYDIHRVCNVCRCSVLYAGVYPLIYLPGVMGTFIAISPEESELPTLREAANAALTAPVAAPTDSLLQPTGWHEADRRAFVTGPTRDHMQQLLRYVLPVRSLALVRK